MFALVTRREAVLLKVRSEGNFFEDILFMFLQFLQVCLRSTQQHTLVSNSKDRFNDVHRCVQQDCPDVRERELWKTGKTAQRPRASEEDARFQRRQQGADPRTEASHIFRGPASLREAGFGVRGLH